MDVTEAIAVIILILAIAILVYYYLLNNPSALNKLRDYVPSSADAHMEEVLGGNPADLSENAVSPDKEESMTKRIKVKLSDIDMSGLNTDGFSNKLDAFLDAKSDELIKDWSLATTDDLVDLEKKFNETADSVDDLDKDYKEFKKSSEEFKKITEKKLDDLDKRIESLENN